MLAAVAAALALVRPAWRWAPPRASAAGAAAGVDGSAAASTAYDPHALLRGYTNPAEQGARAVACESLPADLRGTYFRNGHARFVGYDGRKVRHPFDADGMVTAVTLDGREGRAVVRSRFVATDGAVAERRARTAIHPGQFGNPKPFWAGGANFKNLANTNVLWHGGRLLALWEGGRPHELDPLSLATWREWDIDGLLGRGPTDSFAAHPRVGRTGGSDGRNERMDGMDGLVRRTGWTGCVRLAG